MFCENVGENVNCSDLERIVSFREAVNEENQILFSKRLPTPIVRTWFGMRAVNLPCPEDSKVPSKGVLVL